MALLCLVAKKHAPRLVAAAPTFGMRVTNGWNRGDSDLQDSNDNFARSRPVAFEPQLELLVLLRRLGVATSAVGWPVWLAAPLPWTEDAILGVPPSPIMTEASE